MKHKVGDRVSALDTSGAVHSVGVVHGVDSTGRFHLVKYDEGGEEFLPPEALKPEFPEGSVEAIDDNGEHWKVIPPEPGQEFHTMVCMTKTKAEEKAAAVQQKADDKAEAVQAKLDDKSAAKADAADAAQEKKESKK